MRHERADFLSQTFLGDFQKSRRMSSTINYMTFLFQSVWKCEFVECSVCYRENLISLFFKTQVSQFFMFLLKCGILVQRINFEMSSEKKYNFQQKSAHGCHERISIRPRPLQGLNPLSPAASVLTADFLAWFP